jgi:general secretion pathway protein I
MPVSVLRVARMTGWMLMATGVPKAALRWLRNATRAARHPPARAGGFTLVEVLIAFVIAFLALGVLAQAGADGLRSLHGASRYEEALARARSRLAIALHGAPLLPGDHQGDDGGGFRWRVLVTPADGPVVRPLGERGPRRLMRVQTTLYAVSVQVWWTEDGGAEGPRREVRLDTLHVASSLLPRGGPPEPGR